VRGAAALAADLAGTTGLDVAALRRELDALLLDGAVEGDALGPSSDSGGSGGGEGRASLPLTPGAVTGLANCGVELTAANAQRDIVLSLSYAQLRRLNADELRAALGALGVGGDPGNRYKMFERLLDCIRVSRR
jgi:hypothetical protein